MGRDSVEPYLAYPDKGVLLLCRTSNPGGSDLQALDVGGRKLYEHVAEIIAKTWNTTASAAWWSAPPSRQNSPGCAKLSARCRFWFPASGRRVATWKRR